VHKIQIHINKAAIAQKLTNRSLHYYYY